MMCIQRHMEITEPQCFQTLKVKDLRIKKILYLQEMLFDHAKGVLQLFSMATLKDMEKGRTASLQRHPRCCTRMYTLKANFAQLHIVTLQPMPKPDAHLPNNVTTLRGTADCKNCDWSACQHRISSKPPGSAPCFEASSTTGQTRCFPVHLHTNIYKIL